MGSKTIVVTGANRGIGLEICRQLGALGHRVILTARNASAGLAAGSELRKHGYEVHFYQLDLENPQSISLFHQEFSHSHSTLDVLINNAGVLIDQRQHLRDIPMDLFDRMMNINFKGPLLLTRMLLPLLRKSADPRVINISSGMGALSSMGSGNPAYRISKTALNAMTALFHAEEQGISFNSVCPGWVRTEMGGAGASRPVEKGAETPVWLAVNEKIPSGKFLRDRKEIEW